MISGSSRADRKKCGTSPKRPATSRWKADWSEGGKVVQAGPGGGRYSQEIHRGSSPRALVGKQLLPYRFGWPQMDAAAIHEHNRTCRPRMREALAQWPLLPLTAESLTQ